MDAHEDKFWSELQEQGRAEREAYERQYARKGGPSTPSAGAGAIKQGFHEIMRAVSSAVGKVSRVQMGAPPGTAMEMSSTGYRRMDEMEEDKDDRDGWAPVANLDVFFQNMYKYYQAKGLLSVAASGVANLLSMAFTVALSTWLFAFVDWHRLGTCTDEASCHTLDYYIHWEALSRPWAPRYALVWLYCLLFCAYWCVCCYWFLLTLKDAADMQRVYEDRLGISAEQLATIEWHEVVSRLLAKQRSGEYRVSISRDMTAHDIACRIMRRENFLIALLNSGCLNLSLRLPYLGSRQRGSWAAYTEQQFLTRNLEWSLHVCVLDDMFSEKFAIRRGFLGDEEGLRRRFLTAGLVQLALMPFLLVFMVMQFFLQNAQEWHSKRNYLGPRQWSPMALWKFREYNELPHVFERRLSLSYPLAMEYTKQAPQPVVVAVARCLSYLSGSVVAVLLLFTLIEENILLHVKLWDRNLLWYVGIFSAIFAMSRSFLPSPEDTPVCDPEDTMRRLAVHTHYFPAHWRGRCGRHEVRQEFLVLFKYKAALFVQEVLSAVITPAILCFSLPESARSILAFVREQHEEVEGLGAVCSYSLFDLHRYGNARFGAEADGRYPTSDGKVEKSLLNFMINHPEQPCGPSAEGLASRLNTFRERSEAAAADPTASPPAANGHNFNPNFNFNPNNPGLAASSWMAAAGGWPAASANMQVLQQQCAAWHTQQLVAADPMQASFYWLERYAETGGRSEV